MDYALCFKFIARRLVGLAVLRNGKIVVSSVAIQSVAETCTGNMERFKVENSNNI
jgi:hypothetical protein